jgi:hypothetical protein
LRCPIVQVIWFRPLKKTAIHIYIYIYTHIYTCIFIT